MKVERCPHCKSMAMFAADHCSRCRKHRTTAALMPAEEMRTLLEQTRRLVTMKTENAQANADQESRLGKVWWIAILAGLIVIYNGVNASAPLITVMGVAMIFGGLQLYLRAAIKFVSIFLLLAGGFFAVIRVVDLVLLVLMAGPVSLVGLPFWALGTVPFAALAVMCFKIVAHDPSKHPLPPPVPKPGAAQELNQQVGDKS